MACNCKHEQEAINEGAKTISELRALFIKRMTVDSETADRRKRDFNQAIFHVYSDEEIDEWNRDCENYGLGKLEYGDSYPVWTEVDLNMVLKCYDDAVKDWRRTFCDVENCRRK